jgi:type 1 fimbria pilin
MAGANPTNLPIEIESDATDIRSYSFSLTNGDRLIALWTDGVAVDEDPGVNAALTITNFSAQKVTGIDVLKGDQQLITTSNESGNLMIKDLIVRDYPLILRITNSNK